MTTDHTRDITTAAHPGELANRLIKIHDEAKTFSDPWSEVARAVWAVMEGKDAEIERLRGDLADKDGIARLAAAGMERRGRERDEARAAVDVAVAAERERIAAVIEADAAGVEKPSHYESALRRAARIARSTTDGGES